MGVGPPTARPGAQAGRLTATAPTAAGLLRRVAPLGRLRTQRIGFGPLADVNIAGFWDTATA